MKKFICLLVVVVLAVASIPVAGATTLTVAGGEVAQSELMYSVESSYEIIIPESIGLNQPYRFEATKTNLRDNQQLSVVCENYNAITLTNSDGVELGATINATDGGIVGSFGKGDKFSSIEMVADVDDSDKPAGDYTGTATFALQMNYL